MNVLDKYYLTPQDIQQLVPISLQSARQLARSILREMEEEGRPILKSKTMLVPKRKVLERLGLI